MKTTFFAGLLIGLVGCATANKIPTPPMPPIATGMPSPPMPGIMRNAKAVKAAPGLARVGSVNPINVNVSFVGKFGVQYAFGKSNGTWFVTEATNLVPAAMLKAITNAPTPKRMTKGATTFLILPSGPGQSISSQEWDPGRLAEYVVTTNLVSGKSYFQQFTTDFKSWANTGNSVNWTSTDPNSFWGTIRLVPEFAEGFEFYRIMTP